MQPKDRAPVPPERDAGAAQPAPAAQTERTQQPAPAQTTEIAAPAQTNAAQPVQPAAAEAAQSAQENADGTQPAQENTETAPPAQPKQEYTQAELRSRRRKNILFGIVSLAIIACVVAVLFQLSNTLAGGDSATFSEMLAGLDWR